VSPVPVGLSAAEIIKLVAEMQALGEIANVPPPQLDPIVAAYKASLELKPTPP